MTLIKSLVFLKVGYRNSNTAIRKVSILRMHFFPILEKMLLADDKKEVCGAILTDLSKAFSCISCSLLTATLHVYGLIEMC